MFKVLLGILISFLIFILFPGISFLGGLAIVLGLYVAWKFGETVISIVFLVFLGHLLYLILSNH